MAIQNPGHQFLTAIATALRYGLYDLERIGTDAAALMADPTTTLGAQDGVGLEATCELTFD